MKKFVGFAGAAENSSWSRVSLNRFLPSLMKRRRLPLFAFITASVMRQTAVPYYAAGTIEILPDRQQVESMYCQVLNNAIFTMHRGEV